MSTVLWCNSLREGTVHSDQVDKWALHKHCERLDEFCTKHGIEEFSQLLDYTDYLVNIGEKQLPDELENTDQLMARDGVWVDSAEATQMLDALVNALAKERPRFGRITNDYPDVMLELDACLEFAKAAQSDRLKCNLSVIM